MLDLIWFDTLMVFLKDFFLKILNLNQISRRQKFTINFPACRGNRQDCVNKMYMLWFPVLVSAMLNNRCPKKKVFDYVF